MCTYCKGSDLKESFTTFVTTIDGITIVIRNVPCSECTQCGEVYYSTSVVENLDQMVESILEAAQKLDNDVLVAEYRVA